MAKVLSLHPREGYYLADKFPVWLAKTPEAVERIFCEQLEDNLFTMTPFAPLSPEESSALDRALAAYLSAGTSPCTGCRYCMDCPFGVDIPRHFALYNQYRLDGRASHFTNTYEFLGTAHQATRCVRCGACLPLCPQHIAIPDRLAEVVSAVEGVPSTDS